MCLSVSRNMLMTEKFYQEDPIRILMFLHFLCMCILCVRFNNYTGKYIFDVCLNTVEQSTH